MELLIVIGGAIIGIAVVCGIAVGLFFKVISWINDW